MTPRPIPHDHIEWHISQQPDQIQPPHVTNARVAARKVGLPFVLP
jgi:hypothetical protein